MEKFIKHLTIEHLQDLKLRKTAKESFSAAMDVPKKCLEEHTAMGEISGRPIGVIDWATAESVSDLHKKLCAYDTDFKPEYRNKSQL